MKRVLGHLRRADEDFGMIKDGDSVAVGLSGGKDSMALLYALHLYKYFSKLSFELSAFTVDLGFPGFDTDPISEYCASLGINHTIISTNISKVVFDVRQESNPCSLCSKLRKGALFAEIKKQGIKKCAFAHHRDDLIETLFMSMLYAGRLQTFAPVTYLSRQDVTLIRPFIYLPEKDIKAAVKKHAIPVVVNPCPASGSTKREEIKRLLDTICIGNPKFRDNMLTAIRESSQYSLWGSPKEL